MRRMILHPPRRAKAQLIRNVRALPRWSAPVGDGARRVTLSISGLYRLDTRERTPHAGPVGLRRLSVFLALAAACAPPLIARRLDVALPPATPPACHLVVWWRDASPTADPKPPPGAAAAVARLVAQQTREACLELPTRQIVDRWDGIDPRGAGGWTSN